MTDDSQTNQKIGQLTDRSKNDASAKKEMFPEEHIFLILSYHIMYKFVYTSTG